MREAPITFAALDVYRLLYGVDGRPDADAVAVVHRLVRRHKLPVVRGLRPYRFARAAVEAWIVEASVPVSADDDAAEECAS